ncbi:ABC transporter permease [Pseudonocardia spinosispora]|uniref:ABC transporter permease n=1 Tax=Pseudonocardia spinosispora TaxID=103441 RepID=UPI00041C6347|nr:ABC transporter permease [Pseudonocardia spinosispora]
MFSASVLELATPLILAALGCLLTVRAGIVNIGLEGMMLVGAFAGAAISVTEGGPWTGLLGAAVAGMMLAALLGWAHLTLGADVVLSGIAVNLVAAGATVMFLYSLTRSDGVLTAQPLPAVRLPFLEGVPVLDAFASQSPITWLLVPLVPLFAWAYANTRAGIRLRAVGDNASAVVEAGISPERVRWSAMLASGLMAGVAGAQLSLFSSHTFVRDMTQGRGFIALAAVYLGVRHPIGTVIAALVFGGFQALSTVLQVRTGIPTDSLQALPYVVTVVALAAAGIRHLRGGKAMRLY